MGFDISYHPIKKEEFKELYFNVLKDTSLISKIGQQFKIEDFYQQKYADIIKAGLKTNASEAFEKTHGYYIAIIQGFFRTYFYTRGAAYSFLIEEKPYFKNYTSDLKILFPTDFNNSILNKITENYSSGIYISADQVVTLLSDYKTNENVKNDLDNFYSHKRIEVFLTALEYCKENDLGLLEATEVVEPNPLEMEKSISYSNLFNCDKEGVYLYIDATMEQIRGIEEKNNIESGDIAKNAEYVKTEVGEAEAIDKKGFWKRLFS